MARRKLPTAGPGNGDFDGQAGEEVPCGLEEQGDRLALIDRLLVVAGDALDLFQEVGRTDSTAARALRRQLLAHIATAGRLVTKLAVAERRTATASPSAPTMRLVKGGGS